MLTADGCQQRRARLWSRMPESVEWLLICDQRHVCYLSAFWVNPISFSAGEKAVLLLTRDGGATLLADNFTRRTAVADPFVTDEVIEKWYDHKHSVPNRSVVLHQLRERALSDLVKDPGAERGVIESDHSAAGRQLNTTLRELRRTKHADELAVLGSCMRACEAGHAVAFDAIKPGATELDVYQAVQSAAISAAGQPVIVYGDFRATSADVPKAGGLPGDRVLQAGDLFILDYSVVVHGYRSDFTNTIAVADPTLEQQQLFDTCVSAMSRAEALLSPGCEAAAIYAAASTVLKDAGYGALAHHAGHGLGLGHPEAPVFGPESEDVLVTGDVVTVEPGAYVPEVGGVRVERNYAITETGYERLSNHRVALR